MKSFISDSITLMMTRNGSTIEDVTLTKEQKDSAIYEMHESYLAASKEKHISETEWLEDWCERNDINYKSYKDWEKNKKVYSKTESKIARAVNQTFRSTTLPCYEFQTKNLFQAFQQYDKLLIESVWRIEDIIEVDEKLIASHNLLQECWIKAKEVKSSSDHNENIKFQKEAVTLITKFLDHAKENNLDIHANKVAPIQNMDPHQAPTLMICISALPRVRADVLPPNLYIEPNLANLI
jgi:hypothetical protein